MSDGSTTDEEPASYAEIVAEAEQWALVAGAADDSDDEVAQIEQEANDWAGVVAQAAAADEAAEPAAEPELEYAQVAASASTVEEEAAKVIASVLVADPKFSAPATTTTVALAYAPEAEEEKQEEISDTTAPETSGDVVSNFLNDRAAEYDGRDADVIYMDDLNDMTWGRRLARYLSATFSWYDPSKDNPYTSLDHAWAYFEHSTLPRHLPKGNFQNSLTTSTGASFRVRNTKDILQKAEYGERQAKTQLYSAFWTPESELGDFGLSVGIYFWTLRVLAFICLIAGLVQIPNMIFFAQDFQSFDDTQEVSTESGLQGSAVCSDSSWVACPTCRKSDWDTAFGVSTYSRFATSVDGSGLYFILKNNCSISFNHGIVSFCSLVFVCISIVIMNAVSRRREVYIDSLSQTTSDYAVEVPNPPRDAFDPDEWKAFFATLLSSSDSNNNGEDQIAAITVALDNEELIRTLVLRRHLLSQLKYRLKPGVTWDPNDLSKMVESVLPLGFLAKYILFTASAQQLRQKVRACEIKAHKLATTQPMCVSHIFCCFETEEAQHQVINTLSRPGYQRFLGADSAAAIPAQHKFRGTHALTVQETAEPSSIRWHNLDETLSVKCLQVFASFLLTFSAIVVGAILVALAGRESPIWASITITSINQVTPRICKFITNRFESHPTDGNRQASLYIKMTIFKWVNTAIVTAIITPFVYTIAPQELLHKVNAIFFAELITNPLLLMSDIWGHIQRHVLGPRAPDQERMNLNFRGGTFLISLRYTEMTKILFLTFFYSAIYPAGFFFAAASLSVNYLVDRFCLLRTYGPAPLVGTSVAELSRSLLFPAAFLTYAIMVSYNYAGFPFDNACPTNEVVPEEYVGGSDIVARTGEGVRIVIPAIAADDTTVSYCLQDMLRFRPGAFPAIPLFQREGQEWMDAEQEQATRLLGWTSVVIVAIVTILFLHRVVWSTLLRKFLCKPTKPTGEASSRVKFSNMREPYGYVPQVKSSKFQYPLLACDISAVESDFLDWSDPGTAYPFDKHNLIHDLPGLLLSPTRSTNSNKKLFSVMKTWQHRHRSKTLQHS